MATLYKLPCIFVVENNKWAIGMNHPRATGAERAAPRSFALAALRRPRRRAAALLPGVRCLRANLLALLARRPRSALLHRRQRPLDLQEGPRLWHARRARGRHGRAEGEGRQEGRQAHGSPQPR